ncbi:MAG: NAD(P)H-dependent oxidoreductase [Planctomycetota bacterium]
MRILLLSCSLNPESRSARLLKLAQSAITEADPTAKIDGIDLRDLDLPLCDAGPAYRHPAVKALSNKILQADAVILGLPIYNYDVNAAAKNAIELTGRAWTDKVVGFVCSAGGQGSYMSVMALANSLMLDFRCLVVPRFVYATEDAVRDDGKVQQVVYDRINTLGAEVVRITRALAPVQAEQV